MTNQPAEPDRQPEEAVVTVRGVRTTHTLYMITITRALPVSALLITAPFLALRNSSQAEEEVAPQIDTTTVVANRILTPINLAGSAVSVIDGTTLREAQIHRLEAALRRAPGVFSESTGGQLGSVSSLFLRGTSTSQAHLQVDGVRLSDSTVSSNNFLGNATLGGVDRIEILRGPQSALYGGESIGGVVGIYSRRGEGDPTTTIFTEGGSFGTFRTGMTSQGAFEDGLAYALSLGWDQSHNDPQGTPDLDQEQFSYAMRFDYDVSDHARLAATFRGGHAEFHDPFGGENFTDYQLVTLVGTLDVNEQWTSRLRFGAYNESYDFGDPSTFATDAEKVSLAWENELTAFASDAHSTAFGLLFEQTDFEQDFSFPADRDQFGAYATHVWEPREDLTWTGGIRWEDYDDYGDDFTWRTTVAYEFPRTDTILRASYGTAFRTPNLLELNGGPFEAGNPNLDPESSEGWDIGITQPLGEGLLVHLTWFENEVEDQIVDPFGTAPSNTSGKGNANGLELSLDGHSEDERFRFGLNYTYLQRSLIGLPEHLIEGHLQWEATDRLNLGAGVSFVGDRNLGGDPLEDYLLVRLFGNYRMTENMALHARVENALDERFEHASFGGLPVAGRRLGAFLGVTMQW